MRSNQKDRQSWTYELTSLLGMIAILIVTIKFAFFMPFPEFGAKPATNVPLYSDRLHYWSELIYFWCSSLLLVVAAFGLYQLKLTKQDMRERELRASKEKAIDYASRYLTIFIPMSNEAAQLRQSSGVGYYTGEVGDFSLNSLSEEAQQQLSQRLEEPHNEKATKALNELEAIAAAYVSTVGDEQTGFGIVGRDYCNNVRGLYDVICYFRGNKPATFYKNIAELYQIWEPRLKVIELETDRKRIDAHIQKLNRPRQTP